MSASYRFGRFELRPGTRQLLVDGDSAALGARAFDVLHALIARREQLVTKDELIETAWPGVVVEENNLQVQISTLRKLLGPQAIATIPGRGYRFTLELEEADAERSLPPAGHPHNLPQPLTSFIGRESDLVVYSQMLEQSRLLTLTGIGGCGKTRLAIKLAESALPSFPHGVWFVDLAPLKDADRVTLSVATTLKIKEVPGTSLIETVSRHLATKRSLLVLDNCEHLLDAVSTLVQAILAVSRDVKMLVTSREGLSIEGERLFVVRSMSVPPVGAAHDVSVVEASEAARLFVDRAQMVDARFRLNEKSAPAIAEICRRLDGIPLAIELAAARMQMLSVIEIRARLDDRFRLLAGGRRSAFGRHETLRATIQWSYDQLELEAQRLFRGLSVFVGGWTLAGAMAAWGPGADEFVVLDLLTRLSDKSLIATESIESGPTRYSMLETVRQYAQELLQASQEMDAARTRHLDYYLSLAKAAERKLEGPEQGEWLARLEREHENLMAAHGWCDSADGGAVKGLQLAARLARYWSARGLYLLGMRIHREALGRAGAEHQTNERAGALHAAGVLSLLLGEISVARAYAEDSLGMSRALGDRASMAYALDLLAVVVADPAESLNLFDEEIAIVREFGDKRRLAVALLNRGERFREMGNLVRAMVDQAEALAYFREAGDLQNIALTLWNLAAIDIELGNLDTARPRLAEGIRLMVDTADKSSRQTGVDVAAALAMAQGDAMRAARAFGMTDAFREELCLPRLSVDDGFIQPWLVRARAKLGEARFAAAEAEGRLLSHEEAIAETLDWLEQPQDAK